MPAAARLFDPSNHPGAVMQGSPNVFINGLPAARKGDQHVCALAPVAGPHPPSAVAGGSATVFINGQPAARQLDTVGCGASIAGGSPTVQIGD